MLCQGMFSVTNLTSKSNLLAQDRLLRKKKSKLTSLWKVIRFQRDNQEHFNTVLDLKNLTLSQITSEDNQKRCLNQIYPYSLVLKKRPLFSFCFFLIVGLVKNGTHLAQKSNCVGECRGASRCSVSSEAHLGKGRRKKIILVTRVEEGSRHLQNILNSSSVKETPETMAVCQILRQKQHTQKLCNMNIEPGINLRTASCTVCSETAFKSSLSTLPPKNEIQQWYINRAFLCLSLLYSVCCVFYIKRLFSLLTVENMLRYPWR